MPPAVQAYTVVVSLRGKGVLSCRQSSHVENLALPLIAGLDDLSLHKLYVGASQPGYMEGTGSGARRLQALCDKLERLSTEQARQLLGSFQECAAAVWRGTETFASELRTVQVKPFHPSSSLNIPL